MNQTMPLTKQNLVDGFRALGLKNGDLVLAHSSLASFGEVEGGAETVCEALIEACGPDGTVAMPTMGGKRPWRVDSGPSMLGIITETFRLREDTIRSLHPSHSVAARGPKAEELTRDHYRAESACGKGTPYGRLIDWGGKILLIGCDQDRNTTLHTFEDYADLPYLSDNKGQLYNENGELVDITMKRFPGPHRDFIGINRMLLEAGAMTVGKVGKAVCRLMDGKATHDALMAALAKDPALFLCENPNCRDCVQQRGGIKLHRLETEEDFTLTASTDVMGDTIAEIVLECQGLGLRQIEVSTLEGADVLELQPAKREELSDALTKANIQVSAVRSNRRPDDIDSLLKAAHLLGAQTIVAPLVHEVVERIVERPDEGILVLLENTTLSPDDSLELIQELGDQNVGMAFNPANFSQMGQMPFLQAYYRRRNKLRIRQLVIADATRDGEPTLPGQGNGEVKELMSTLRTRSFDGTFCLRGPLTPGKTFRDHAAAFWQLLDTM